MIPNVRHSTLKMSDPYINKIMQTQSNSSQVLLQDQTYIFYENAYKVIFEVVFSGSIYQMIMGSLNGEVLICFTLNIFLAI